MIDIFEPIEESEPITMSKTEYIEKAKKLIEYIATEYNRCWQSRALTDNEYPDESICEKCKRESCIYPNLCKNLDNSHAPMLTLYDKILKIKGIKKFFIGSGIRYDLFLNEKIVLKNNFWN